MKITTIDVLTIEDLHMSIVQEILNAAVEYFKHTRPAMLGIGISWQVADNSIEVSGPKQYLGVDEIRTQHVNLRQFCLGYAWAKGYQDAYKHID